MKNVLRFIGLFAYVIGVVAGFGNCVCIKEFIPAICIVVLAFMAFPTAKNWFQHLTGKLSD